MNIKAVLTDIEGTTSAIRFVHDVLFPYAARELPGFVRARQRDGEIAGILEAARREANEPGASVDRLIEIFLDWIREDRKATALKSLQGHIWRRGYVDGDFTGHVYDDAVNGLRRWAAAGIRLFVYSSGSVDAQKLLFGHSDAGDLQPLFEAYFDTRTGHKRESDSYEKIAKAIMLPAGNILFLSDTLEELDAARVVGMQTCQLVRDNRVATGVHTMARNFDEVIINGET